MSGTVFLHSLGMLLNLLLFLSIGFLTYLVILDILLDYKIAFLKDTLGKLENIGKGGFEPLEVSPDGIKPLSAVEANKLKHESVTQAEIDTLLKPVFDKIVKASENGDSEIFLSGSGWYHCKNEQYKTATQQLTALGYSVWRDDNGFGVRVKW